MPAHMDVQYYMEVHSMAKLLVGETDYLDNQINRINKMLQSAAKTLGTSSELYKSYEAQIAKLTAYDVTVGGKTHHMVRTDKNGVLQITRGKMARGAIPGGNKSALQSQADRAANIARILNEFDKLAAKKTIRAEKKRIEGVIREAAAKKGKPIKGKPTSAQIQAAAKKLASASQSVRDILDYLYAHEQAIEAQKQSAGAQGITADTRYERWHVSRALNMARKKGQKRTYAELQAIARHAASVQQYNREHGLPDIAATSDIEDIL